MADMPSRQRILERYRLAERCLSERHIRTLPGQPGSVLLISDAYPGVWLEHAFDGVCYARLYPESTLARSVARNQMLLFLRNQRADGRLPFCVLDEKRAYPGMQAINFTQIQECVAFARLCLEVYELTGDRAFLAEAYAGCVRWDEWLCAHRMTRNTGLIELFCLFDTGHDNSARLQDIPLLCPDPLGALPADSPALPLLAPDMNAVFYGDRLALRDMAQLLGRGEEAAAWARKAENVQQAMLDRLFDEKDLFFYDRDAAGHFRRFRSIAVSNVFSEHVLSQSLFDRIYDRHMRDPDAFFTPFPFPSMALNDPAVQNHAMQNCWGYFSQALTALRCQRWMDFYHREADHDRVLRRWVSALAGENAKAFTQELDPLTGQATDCSEGYSSAMLLYLYAVRRLKYLD